MKNFSLNHYERAFGNWLIDNKIQFIEVDEHKRAAFGGFKIKSFDYMLYPPNQKPIIAEVKGRKFAGSSVKGFSGFQNWVSLDDIAGLSEWQRVLGSDYMAAFVFVYRFSGVNLSLDEFDVYEYNGEPYCFFCVRLGDYCREMTVRSPRWKTVFLPVESFKKYAVRPGRIFA